MSLLYECINGIIEGGILGSSDDSVGGEEIASLCVSKLRGMIMVEGDANCESSSTLILHVSNLDSKICRFTCFQQDRLNSLISCCRARRRHYGMY